MSKNIDLMAGHELAQQDFVNVAANKPWQIVAAGATAIAAAFLVANGEGLVTTRAAAVITVEESSAQLPEIPKQRQNSDVLYKFQRRHR